MQMSVMFLRVTYKCVRYGVGHVASVWFESQDPSADKSKFHFSCVFSQFPKRAGDHNASLYNTFSRNFSQNNLN